MKTKIVLFFLFLSSIVIGQNQGWWKSNRRVWDPVAFCKCYFKNSKEGVITDENGNFYLNLKKNYSTLVVSYVGF